VSQVDVGVASQVEIINKAKTIQISRFTVKETELTNFLTANWSQMRPLQSRFLKRWRIKVNLSQSQYIYEQIENL
jgi:hypothetical protein